MSATMCECGFVACMTACIVEGQSDLPEFSMWWRMDRVCGMTVSVACS